MKIQYTIAGFALMLACHASATAPKELTVCEGFVDPLGLHDSTPTFSWKLPVGVQSQAAYQIEVNNGTPVWDSGWVESDQSVFVPYGGTPFDSRERIDWRVRFRDEAGAVSDWSPYASFELGLLSSNDWKAKWIHLPEEQSLNHGAMPKIEVLKAIYRSKAFSKKQQDVTELVRSSVLKKEPIVASNTALKGDPAPGEVKELVLTYFEKGNEKELILDEGTQWPESGGETLERVSMLRRDFVLPPSIKKARLYVTARGVFQISLNGQRVGEDYFANGWTSYSKRIDTLTYDVTDHLKNGDNQIEAKLGTGWYAGRLVWKDSRHFYGDKPELLLQLEVELEDGSVKTMVSDEQWEGSFEGPILSSSIYDGEHYDARRKPAGWKPVSASSDLGSALLVPKPFAPVRITETLIPQTITEPEPGRFVFDLGQNMVGWQKLKIPVEKDQTITIRFAEMLNPDGTMYTANYRSAKSTDSYTAAETGTTEWEPVFTFHGFRYVELSGFPVGVTPTKDWVQGIVLHSDLPRIGTFESSHEKLNQLQSNITWGQRGNFLDIPTDCPQRDERLGWTGDAQAFTPTAMFNYDCLAFFKSWLGSMRDDQMKDGKIPHVIPDVLKKGGSPGWMDAATIIPWEVYVRSGDTEVLSENYEMMERLVGWYRSQTSNNLIPKIGGFGDWLQPYAKDQKGDTPQALLGSAFYARSIQILADSAQVLGKNADAETYGAEAAAVRKAFAAHYFDSDGKLQHAPESQTAYIVAFEFDLVPEDVREQSAKHLLRLIADADGHLRTGFLGTPYIATVLDENGSPETAFSLLFKETYPSWFYSINQGATTMWERWNSYSHEDGFGNVAMNSFNHYAYGAIGQWMVERVAGLAPDPAHPGYKHFYVRPVIGGPLTWARAELETAYGTASSGWKKKGNKLQMEVVVPPNTTATIEFPNGRKAETVSAGTHQFELDI